MKIGLVVDSACDLPLAYLSEHDIEIMPITLSFGDDRYVDKRDPEATVQFYDQVIPEHGLQARSEPFSVNDIRDLFLDRLVTRFDRVLVVAIASTRSEIFDNATKASFAILSGYRQRRQAAGLEGNFMLRVLDSGQLFTGEGVLVWELQRWLQSQADPHLEALLRHAEDFKRHVYAYAVPRDLFYLRARARQRGDRSVGWFQFQLGSKLDIKPIVEAHQGDTHPIAKVRHFDTAVDQVITRAIERIDNKRLLSPVVVMSYAGRPREIHKFPAYQRLKVRAQEAGVSLVESTMSTTAGIYLGPGAFSLGYAAEE